MGFFLGGGEGAIGVVELDFVLLLEVELEHADVDGAAFAGRDEGSKGAQDFLATGEGIREGCEDVPDQDRESGTAAGGGLFFGLLFVFCFHIMKLRYMKSLHTSREK